MEVHSIVPFFLALAIIIMGARLFGSLARFIGQPRVLGELLAGVVLGPTLLNMSHWLIFHDIQLQEMVQPLAELGVLFLMFIIGLEVELSELTQVGRVAIFGGLLGAFVPVILTIPGGMVFGYSLEIALFAGVTLAATSVSISAQVLLEMGHLRSKEGNALLATTLIDDILAILMVSITVVLIGSSLSEGAATNNVLMTIARMIMFIAIGFFIAWFVLPTVMNKFAEYPVVVQSNGIGAIAIVFMLIFAWASEALGGIAMITGSFMAGLGLSRVQDHIKHEIVESSSAITYTFLMPIFFINVGLSIDLSIFPLSALPLGIVLLIIAIISKVGGVGLGAKLGGFANIEALRVGVCMISRGEVGLIIATLGISSGILNQDDPLFASLFLVILLTTLLTPILVRQVFPDREAEIQKEGAST